MPVIEVIEALDDEQVETPEEKQEEKQPEKQPAPAYVNPDVLAEQVAQRLAQRSQNTSAAAQSRLHNEVAALIREGLQPEVLDRLIRLNEAMLSDREEFSAVQTQQQIREQFNVACWQVGKNAVEEIIAAIPQLADEDEKFIRLMTERTSEKIANSPEFVSVKSQISQGNLPDKRKTKEAAAKVVDEYLSKRGLAKQAETPQFKSSKPAPSVEASMPIDEMPKGARMLYAAVLKATGDKNKAMQRAREYLR